MQTPYHLVVYHLRLWRQYMYKFKHDKTYITNTLKDDLKKSWNYKRS